MQFSKVIMRELQVAFSTKGQPLWFRIMKYIVLGMIFYFFWGNKNLLPGVGIAIILAVAIHFWFRYKTDGWTKSYGPWKYDR